MTRDSSSVDTILVICEIKSEKYNTVPGKDLFEFLAAAIEV